MIPYRIADKNDFRAYATFGLIVTYLGVFFWEVILTTRGGMPIEHYLSNYALATCEIGKVPFYELLIDALRGIFMSTSFATLVVNSVFLWIFAPLVERFLGVRRFLGLFLLAGFGGYIFSILFTRSTDCAVIFGPNAAISAMIAAFIFLYPTKRIDTNIPVIMSRTFELPAFVFGVSYLAIQFLSDGGGPLSGNLSPIWDEIGGFVIGFIFLFVLTMFKPAPKADPFEYLDD